MSSPEESAVSPEQAQAAVAEQLSGVAASVAGSDQAGSLDVSQAQPAAPDVSDLLAAVQAQAAQLEALQKQIDAQQSVADGDVKPASLSEALLSSSVGSQVAHLFTIVDERLSALEGHGSEDSAA